MRSWRLALVLLSVVVSACGASPQNASDEPSPAPNPDGGAEVLTIGAIPDQDPEKLQRLYSQLATTLSQRLGVEVAYRPVTDYSAAVSLFRAGDLDVVWFGGLTGVAAQRLVPGSAVLAQRDIDATFRSVFIASTASGIAPMDLVQGLTALAGRRFTFGSEQSTSGRLMPLYFLDQAGVAPSDFAGEPGFSGSHDKTIALVESGTFEAGVLNEQVWKTRSESGQVDTTRVRAIFSTPTYHDYHWLARPDLDDRLGQGFSDRVRDVLLALDPGATEDKAILDLFGAGKFISASPDDYAQIEEIGLKSGLLAQE
ncbi:MAG: putative selenate ABC transporter substrate-binding protein [Acidimicrobiales bacterium]